MNYLAFSQNSKKIIKGGSFNNEFASIEIYKLFSSEEAFLSVLAFSLIFYTVLPTFLKFMTFHFQFYAFLLAMLKFPYEVYGLSCST
jgi:hypothetical protein